MRQFISESMIMSGLAVCVALVLAIVSLPWFNLLTGKSMALDADTIWFALGAVVVIGVVVGFAAGSYPALLPVGTRADPDPQGARWEPEPATRACEGYWSWASSPYRSH